MTKTHTMLGSRLMVVARSVLREAGAWALYTSAYSSPSCRRCHVQSRAYLLLPSLRGRYFAGAGELGCWYGTEEGRRIEGGGEQEIL